MVRTKQDVERLEADLNRIYDSIDMNSEELFNNRIKGIWQRLKTSSGNEQLKTMPLDTMLTVNKELPVNTLKHNGLKTMKDIADKPAQDLAQLDGMDEKTAEHIYQAVSKIKEAVYKQATPRVNPDDISDEDVHLLESIYKKWHLLNILEEMQEKFQEYYDETISDIEMAKKQKGFFGGLFQPKEEKEKIRSAFANLNKNKHQKELKQIKKRLDYMLDFEVSKEELKKHFERENAFYYTEIEKATDFDSKNISESLPEEVVGAVNNHPLDTNGLHITLRNYQIFGAKYALLYKKTLLGDEMGLGKTVQALAILNHLRQNHQGHAVIVCPLSVIAHWKREMEQRSALQAFIFHGSNREEQFQAWQEGTGILITTFELAGTLPLEGSHHFDALVVDEAHYVKNPNTKRSQNVYHLADEAEYVLFMSGTPLENTVEEMMQLVSVLQPGIADDLSEEMLLRNPQAFREAIAPVYLRRNRKDVLHELPDLEIIPEWVPFGEEEKKFYQQAVKEEQVMAMRRAGWQGGSQSKSPKLEKLLEICENAKENGHKVLVFSYFKDVIQTISSNLENEAHRVITGDVSNHKRQEIIDAFTADEAGSVLVSQITAGGVGVNIQAANVVVLCEPQWKPTMEEQAISRAYRMGQSRNVVVYRLLTEESIDVTMLDVLGEKANLFNLFVKESDTASRILDEQEQEEEEASIQKKVLKLEKERFMETVR
ncbi:RNA polymerase-associated protein RapA [Oceanobacillus oncorhynchi]|uniref:RNA polymerase-associated protein RapA n=1 Tax=Oceanobacillus oncorhynchi TaxID=545501 RepID=A0A0A1MFM8_9BACI|nr:DEAD/DEAH box helicase [Oceanobacillus oncorhynchi]CEI81878.1 RNA polymerase-associated protein RapA [Oceanobacillus oncorhynchi]